VYINQAVTRQARLQLVPAPPDPNQAPPNPTRAPPDPNRAPPGPDPARKPSPIGLGRLALTSCCRSRCRSGDDDCIGVGMSPSPLLPLARRRRRRWCRNADGVVSAAPATVLLLSSCASWVRTHRHRIAPCPHTRDCACQHPSHVRRRKFIALKLSQESQ
jgi:hypothetical protein